MWHVRSARNEQWIERIRYRIGTRRSYLNFDVIGAAFGGRAWTRRRCREKTVWKRTESAAAQRTSGRYQWIIGHGRGGPGRKRRATVVGKTISVFNDRPYRASVLYLQQGDPCRVACRRLLCGCCALELCLSNVVVAGARRLAGGCGRYQSKRCYHASVSCRAPSLSESPRRQRDLTSSCLRHRGALATGGGVNSGAANVCELQLVIVNRVRYHQLSSYCLLAWIKTFY